MVARTATPTAQARSWVMDLPEGSLFWSRDVPAPRHIVSQTLSELAKAGDRPPIEHLANGFYWRAGYFESGYPWPRDPTWTALVYAGEGSGYWECSAINKVAWTTQLPAKAHIATMRDCKPLDDCVLYHLRTSNDRRRYLTFAEVTVIEAVRYFDLSEVCWDEAVALIADGTAISRLRYPPAEIRAEAIRWAAAEEPPVRWLRDRDKVPFIDKIHDLCDRIPAEQVRRPDGAERS